MDSVTNIKTKATISNNYFIKHYCTVEISSSLPSIASKCHVTLKSLFIDPDKLLRLLLSLNPQKSHGDDGISIAMIKLCDEAFIGPLCMIYRKCLETGVYPSAWKKSKVVPIHKKESRQLKKNYRPISLLPIFDNLKKSLSSMPSTVIYATIGS